MVITSTFIQKQSASFTRKGVSRNRVGVPLEAAFEPGEATSGRCGGRVRLLPLVGRQRAVREDSDDRIYDNTLIVHGARLMTSRVPIYGRGRGGE